MLRTTTSHMKKHIYLITLLLLAIGLGLLGCSEEDIFETTEVQRVNSIKSQFSPETFNKVISNDYKVDWNVSTLLEHSEELGLDYYEFEISLSENQAPITSKLYDIKQSLFAIKKEGGVYDFYVAKYFMDRWKSEGKSIKDVSFSNMESFSGLLNVFDNNNQMTYAKKMDNGKVLGAPVSLNSDFNTINIETRMFENCEVVPIYHYVDTYHPSSDGQWWVYQYSDLVSISYDLECSTGYLPELDLSGGAPGNYFSQNGGGVYTECEDPRHGCIYEVETELVRFEDLIDDSKLKPCMQNILADIKTQTKGVSWVINRFNYNSPNPYVNFTENYNWTVEDGSLVTTTGETSSKFNRTNKSVTTIFDSNKFGNASDLSIARTILHEAVHAFLVAHFNIDRASFVQDYPDLISSFGGGALTNLNDAHHVEFIRNWLKDIASSLEEFGLKRGYNLPSQYYKDLAWGGLTDTYVNGVPKETPWFIFFVRNATDRQRIKDNLSIELNGLDMNGVTQTQKGNHGGC